MMITISRTVAVIRTSLRGLPTSVGGSVTTLQQHVDFVKY